MPKFEYKIKTASGIEKDTTSAADRETALSQLRKSEGELVSLKEVKSGRWNFDKINNMLVRVKLRDLVVFSRNLAAMIEAGLSLSRSFSILQHQTKNAKMKEILSTFSSDIEQGRPLSASMKKYQGTFSNLFIAMTRAGEQSGTMASSLKIVGGQLEKTYTLRKKIKGAMIYPSIVITAMFAIGIFMFIYVVPTLTQTFRSMDVELPTSTQIIIAFSDVLANYTIISLGIIAAAIVGAFLFLRTAVGKKTLDFSVLYVPVIKNIVKQSNAAYFSRTMSSLLSSGVSIVQALEISKDVVPNTFFKRVIAEAQERVQKGDPLNKVFAEHEGLYPILVGEMIEVGEETGQTAEMLERLADFYESEVTAATENMSQIVEPVLMLVIAGGVGLFAVSMITPIYSISSSL